MSMRPPKPFNLLEALILASDTSQTQLEGPFSGPNLSKALALTTDNIQIQLGGLVSGYTIWPPNMSILWRLASAVNIESEVIILG